MIDIPNHGFLLSQGAQRRLMNQSGRVRNQKSIMPTEVVTCLGCLNNIIIEEAPFLAILEEASLWQHN